MSNDNKNQSGSPDIAHRTLALIGVGLIATGMYLIVTPPVSDSNSFPPQFLLSISGIALLLLSLVLKARPALTLNSWLSRLNLSETTFKVLVAALLSGLTIFSLILFQQNSKFNYIPITLTWLASGVIYVMAFYKNELSEHHFVNWLKENKIEILLVSLAIILGIVLRFYQLGNLPRVIDGDEGRIGLVAKETENNLGLAIPFGLWENIGSLYLQVLNFGYSLFGETAFSLRLLPAISGVLAIPMLYLLARQISGPRIATIAAFLLAISHSHIHFSRIGSVFYIHDTWLIPLELYLLLSGLEKRSSWRAAAAGIILALHFRVYLTSQIVVGLILVFMLISFLLLRVWLRPVLQQCAVFWGGFFLMMAPQINYILQHPSEFTNRLGQDGTFQTGWLQTEMSIRDQSAFEILFGRVIHAFMSLVYYPAQDFFGASSSLLGIFTAILFLIGLGLVLVRAKLPGYLLLNGYFWALTLAIAIFSLPPSADSYRMLAVLPSAYIIAAIGLDQLIDIAGFSWEKGRKSYITLAVGTIMGISILNVWAYYFDFAGQCRYGGGLESRFASYLGSYAKSVDVNSNIYLLSDENFFYGSHASADFLSNKREIANYKDPMDTYQVKYGETLIASPGRIDELLTWSDSHPGGELVKLYDCSRLILVSYKIPIKSFEP
jgi:hypothetical protein